MSASYITRAGVVTVTADNVLIERFVFDGGNVKDARRAALNWAKSRLDEVESALAAEETKRVDA